MAVAKKIGIFNYVLKRERDLPESEQTIWKLQPLTYRQRSEIEQTSYRVNRKTEELLFDLSQRKLQEQLLNCGLKGVHNFRDENGKEFELKWGKDERLTDETLDAISEYATELANAIDGESGLEEDEQKN